MNYLVTAFVLFSALAKAQVSPPIALRKERETLDRTVWLPERLAQQYEVAITGMWDRLRAGENAAAAFAGIVCDQWDIPSALPDVEIGLGIHKRLFDDGSSKTLRGGEFKDLLKALEQEGIKLIESEFHHTSFRPGSSEVPAQSIVSFLLNAEGDGQRFTVTGDAVVVWRGPPDGSEIRAEQIRLNQVKVLFAPVRTGFVKVATFEPRANEFQSAHPVLLNDLDHDGDAEIIIPRWNRVYDNQLATKNPTLADRSFLKHWKPQEECGLLADFDGDGQTDYITLVKGDGLTFYRGAPDGSFPETGSVLFQHPQLHAVLALTAGDIDTDGDLDLWVTQYKPSYVGGQMPTPFYDANDGLPSFLLRNDRGQFVDITEEAGLAKKRFRRTYSTSFVDLDRDQALDLLVVSDYAGVDVYRNNGKGVFEEITAGFGPTRLFGMSHSLADYNNDGLLDLLAIGMSSSTARRLDGLGLGLEERRDYQQFRADMGYGNRLYLQRNGVYAQGPKNHQIARTGWSWGVSSFDFDNDGDRDIYVANGFRSGKSAKDYCTSYWCHDLYTGDSKENPQLVPLFADSMRELNLGLSSWNGFEHNHLKMNLGDSDFENIAFLLGVGFEYDSRVVLTEDFDRDGREDLLVSEYLFMGRGFQSKIHLYLNRTPLSDGGSHWIEFVLRPSVKQAVIGATVSLFSARGVQMHPIVTGDSFLSQDAWSAHFGLGKNASVEKVTVHWPGGATSMFVSPEVDRVHVIRANP